MNWLRLQSFGPPSQPGTFTIKRHPIGLLSIYLQTGSAMVGIIVLGVLIAPDYLSNLSSAEQSLIAMGIATLLVLIGGIMAVATVVYNRNKILVTDHDIEQTIQRSLLVRKISRLEMNDVEDVTCEQKGLFQTMFGYGTLTIETAGAIENFIFPYCPRPNDYAHSILTARASYVAKRTPTMSK